MIYGCGICGWEYDESEGSLELEIEPGTEFEDLADGFECPHCGAGKDDFSPCE